MEMIVVGGVVLGPQYHMEIATGPRVHCPQEARFHPRALPMLLDADLPPARQDEAADVEGVGGRMLAADLLPERIADNVAAGVGAEGLDRGDALAKNLLGNLLHVVREPKGERDGRFTGGLVESGVHTAC